ncbi:MAG: hypothetical protein RR782_02570 [Clostridium sp.]
MKFIVKRTSMWCDEPPCEGVTFGKLDYVDIRTLNSFEEFDELHSKSEGTWLSKGINHRIREEDGFIERTIPDGFEGYYIEINTLEELIEFKNKYGGSIVLEKHWDSHVECIEIYDDYRE